MLLFCPLEGVRFWKLHDRVSLQTTNMHQARLIDYQINHYLRINKSVQGVPAKIGSVIIDNSLKEIMFLSLPLALPLWNTGTINKPIQIINKRDPTFLGYAPRQLFPSKRFFCIGLVHIPHYTLSFQPIFFLHF